METISDENISDSPGQNLFDTPPWKGVETNS